LKNRTLGNSDIQKIKPTGEIKAEWPRRRGTWKPREEDFKKEAWASVPDSIHLDEH
jgi:hypothetical protein